MTGGTHAGVMKHVGKAVKEYAAIREEDERVVVLFLFHGSMGSVMPTVLFSYYL